ncbi:uncharacterized protein isoform X2 [Leptinotarsa decemlineata]|uniref:uncharacterized protein isoform X2 n=1 Tax=Leptinotarsa decemlineata TaxID=7539 RepID=UPI003D30BAAE
MNARGRSMARSLDRSSYQSTSESERRSSRAQSETRESQKNIFYDALPPTEIAPIIDDSVGNDGPCGPGIDVYGKVLGSTADETILVGLRLIRRMGSAQISASGDAGEESETDTLTEFGEEDSESESSMAARRRSKSKSADRSNHQSTPVHERRSSRSHSDSRATLSNHFQDALPLVESPASVSNSEAGREVLQNGPCGPGMDIYGHIFGPTADETILVGLQLIRRAGCQPSNMEIVPVESVEIPAEPIAIPVEPVSKPVEPVPIPVEPVSKPVEPVPIPVEPVSKPVEPVPIPVEPISKPVKPVPVPVEPVSKPAEPVPIPVEPVSKPVEPVPIPVKPVPKPVEPVPIPVEPVSKPVEPVPIPVEPVPMTVEPIPKPVSQPLRPAIPSKTVSEEPISKQPTTAAVLPSEDLTIEEPIISDHEIRDESSQTEYSSAVMETKDDTLSDVGSQTASEFSVVSVVSNAQSQTETHDEVQEGLMSHPPPSKESNDSEEFVQAVSEIQSEESAVPEGSSDAKQTTSDETETLSDKDKEKNNEDTLLVEEAVAEEETASEKGTTTEEGTTPEVEEGTSPEEGTTPEEGTAPEEETVPEEEMIPEEEETEDSSSKTLIEDEKQNVPEREKSKPAPEQKKDSSKKSIMKKKISIKESIKLDKDRKESQSSKFDDSVSSPLKSETTSQYFEDRTSIDSMGSRKSIKSSDRDSSRKSIETAKSERREIQRIRSDITPDQSVEADQDDLIIEETGEEVSQKVPSTSSERSKPPVTKTEKDSSSWIKSEKDSSETISCTCTCSIRATPYKRPVERKKKRVCFCCSCSGDKKSVYPLQSFLPETQRKMCAKCCSRNTGSNPITETVPRNVSELAQDYPTNVPVQSEAKIVKDMKEFQKGDGNCQALKIKYAITKITDFGKFTTFEIMKSTRKKPKTMPVGLEGVFVLRRTQV